MGSIAGCLAAFAGGQSLGGSPRAVDNVHPDPLALAPSQTRGAAGSRSRQVSERDAIRRAQAGSAEAFEALFRAHWRSAHRAAWLIVHDDAAAEDIAQEAFVSAVRALDRFDRHRPFGPWLHRIVVNRAIDWARAQALRRESGVELPERSVSSEALAAGPYSDALVAALSTLAPDHRAVIVLRYLLDYTPGEIAELLDLPRGTVNSRLRRGLDRLAGALGEESR